MKNLLSLVTLLSTISFITPAIASHGYTHTDYFLGVEFSQFAYGKKVRSVTVHSGVLLSDGSWTSIKDTQLKLEADHFIGKIELSSDTENNGPVAIAPVIQYGVSFEDGSTFTTEIFKVGEKRERSRELFVSSEEDYQKYLALLTEARYGLAHSLISNETFYFELRFKRAS